MGKLKKGILGLETHQIILLCIIFLTCVTGAALILPQYCPDEWARQLVTDWIYKNKALPLGNEPEIQIGNYGYSYALRPYLTSMVNAVFMMISSLLTPSQMALRVASRFSSVLSVTACYFFCIRTGNLFFRKRISSTVFAIMVVFLPQVMFLGMYQNNDSLGLASVTAVLYFLFYGDRFRWPMKTCVALSIAVSVCLLSYYSIYGWLLVGGIFFIYSFVRIKPIDGKALVQKWLSL